jgi:DNA-binding CsgD family transcriptional regulator
MNQQLTPQETEILKLVRAGRTSKQIARQIGVNYHVVNRRVLRIRRVLGARNRLHLCTMAADGELQ